MLVRVIIVIITVVTVVAIVVDDWTDHLFLMLRAHTQKMGKPRGGRMCVGVCVLALVSRLFNCLFVLFGLCVFWIFWAEGSRENRDADHSLVEVAVLFLTNSNWGLKSWAGKWKISQPGLVCLVPWRKDVLLSSDAVNCPHSHNSISHDCLLFQSQIVASSIPRTDTTNRRQNFWFPRPKKKIK